MDLQSIPDKYTYRVVWSEEDKEFVGMCAELPSLSWLAGSRTDALDGIFALVKDTVEDLSQCGENIPVPLSMKRYSGKFTVRSSPQLHHALAVEAAEAGMSLNRWVNSKLSMPCTR